MYIHIINKPKAGIKGKFGCGKYFYWEYEILGLGAFYKTAKSLTNE